MAINIQEILDNDSLAQRIDKINYNFDQIVANGGGPIGLTGSKGASGATGPQGAQGPVGPQGATGAQGAYTDFFVVDDFVEQDSVYLKNDPATTHVSTLTLGEANADTNGSPSVVDYKDSTLRIITNQDLFDTALRIQSSDSTTKFIDVAFNDDGADRILSFKTSAIGALNTVYDFTGSSLTLSSGAGVKVKLDVTESVFTSNTKFNGAVKMPSGAAANKVLKSSDAQGTFTWGDPGVVPIGTIVMAPAFIINNATKIQWTSSGDAAFDYIGRGKDDWAGWYWCNGQTWGTYVTPDLRDRFALGYSKSVADSTPSLTGNTLHGNKNVTQLTNVSVNIPLANHTHTTNIGNTTIDKGDVYNPVSILEPESGGSSDFISGNPDSTPTQTGTIAIAPKSATVIYMIYLEATNLTYSLSEIGGGVSIEGA